MSVDRNDLDITQYGEHIFGREELEDLIRTETLKNDIDVEYLEQLLAQYEKCGNDLAVEVDKAWEQFQFLSENDNKSSVMVSLPVIEKQRRSPRAIVRAAIIAAVIVGALFVGSITAYALGFDFWKVVIKWGRETFGFRTEEQIIQQDRNPGILDTEYTDLASALLGHGINNQVMPTLPEGFELMQLDVISQSDKLIFYATYSFGDRDLMIKILDLYTIPNSDYEVDESNSREIEEYMYNRIRHNITTNLGEYRAAWMNGKLECSISGDISREELIQMIKSIYQ